VSATAAARAAARAVQRLLPRRRAGLKVLAYHLVGAGTGLPVDLPRDRFRRQLDELVASVEVVGLDDAVAALSDGAAAGRRMTAITFDDAYANFAAAAWPDLRARGLPATLYVPVGFVDGAAGPPMRGTGGLRAASWGELGAMAEEGLAIGSHTVSHPDLRRLDDAALDRELRGSREALEARLGAPVRSLCYPRGLWSRRVERRAGRWYPAAVAGGGGTATASSFRPLRIERISVRRDGPASVAPLLDGRVWLEERLADRVRRLRR